jgi:putative protein-disulfide isomerase
MDPLCGWCYGNSENMLRLEQELADQISIDVIPWGMLTWDRIRYQDIALVGMIRSADMRLRSITRAPMSDAYDSLLDDTTILLDSEPPCRAINTIKKIAPEKVLKFSSALARARYVDGIDNTKLETFILVCEKLDIDTDLFLTYYDSEDMKRDTREMFMIASEYTNSYPAIFLVSDDGSMISISLMGYQYSALKNEIMKYI